MGECLHQVQERSWQCSAHRKDDRKLEREFAEFVYQLDNLYMYQLAESVYQLDAVYINLSIYWPTQQLMRSVVSTVPYRVAKLTQNSNTKIKR